MVTTTTGLATSFITFSRPGASGGGATVTLSNGRIGWAGHNLLTNSESFDASSWLKNGVTVTANATAAPSGQSTADAVFETSASGYHLAYSSLFTFLAASYTLAVYVKANGRTRFALTPDSTTVFAADAKFDLSAVTATATSGSASIENIGNGWYRVSITGVSTAGSTNLNLAILDGSGNLTYTGDITKGVYLWGAHLYRSDLGGMQQNPAMGAGMGSYYPTTPRNLLGYSEDLSNVAWTGTGINAFGSGSIANVTTAPNGLQTADLLTESTVNNEHYRQQSFSKAAVNGVYTATCYFKAGIGTRNFGLGITDGTTGGYGAIFSTAGEVVSASSAIGTTTGWTAGSATVDSIGNGWYRARFTATTNTATTVAMALYIVNGTTRFYTGDGTSGIYLWGAQLSDSASLDTYVPQYGAAVTSAAYYAPRLDFDGATLSPRGLLVEEQRSNLATASETFTTNWTALNASISNNVAISPAGVNTASKLVTDNSTTVQGRWTFINVTNGTTYTVSAYVKAAEITRFAFQSANSGQVPAAIFNLSTGEVVSVGGGSTATITAVGSGWYRLTATKTATASGTDYAIIYCVNNSNDVNFAGNGTDGILVWGYQFEAGGFATSYIPNINTVAGVTRTADVASVSTQAFPYSASEGTWVANWSALAATSSARIIGTSLVSDATPLAISSSTAVASWSGATNLVSTAGSSTLGPVKAALGYSAAGRSLVHAGTSATTDSAVMPTQTQFYMGRGYDTSTYMNGHIRQITYLPRRISNAELQSRTA